MSYVSGKQWAILPAATALALWVLGGAAAQARIIPQQGMAGVKLGMSKSEVRDKLGKPRGTATGRNDFGPYTQYRYEGKIIITFQGELTMTSISTTGRRERTKEGIGVGSTERAVRRSFPRVRCRTIVRRRSCYLGSLTPGKRVTDFQMLGGKVRRVTIGFVID
jgi:hypothetical protein